jgi:glutamate dehydrogenase/leucine dehydrogenase
MEAPTPKATPRKPAEPPLPLFPRTSTRLSAQRQFERAADHLGLDPESRHPPNPKRQLISRFRCMDNKQIKVWLAIGAAPTARGPSKGGIRFHPGVTDECQGPGDGMT